MSLFSELKRRNVFRVALFYLVAAWLIVQVAETLLPVFDVPDTAIRIIVLMLVLGFPLAVIFAWVFDLTPDGIKLDSDSDVDPQTKHQTANKLNWATLVVAVLAIGLLVADRLMPESTPVTTELATTEPSQSAVAEKDQDAVEDAKIPNPASIAVLPFDDLSPGGDQEYFSDGIAEEILNVLVRIDGLEVASRTSAFRFRDQQDLGIPGIAEELEVRHVLEGSVRKAGDTIRVTAQLIDGQSDKHLWSETYDRSLTAENVFSIQDEIATAIVDALRGSIDLPDVESPQVVNRTDNLDAYELFLRARTLFTNRNDMDVADDLLAQAVELDPDFAEAWAIRAAIYMLNYDYGDIDLDRAESDRRVNEFAQAALAVEPENALAIAVLANNRHVDATLGRTSYPIAETIADLQRAIEIDPRNDSARNWLGMAYLEVGDLDAALEQFSACTENDPFYAPCVENVYDTLASLGRMDEALAAFRSSLSKGAVTDEWVNFSLLAHFGMKDLFMFASNQSQYLRGWRQHEKIWNAWQNPDADHRQLAAEIRRWADENLDPSSAGSLIENLLVPLGGSFDLGASPFSVWMPRYRAYRQSVEFRERVRKLHTDDYWREHGYPELCRPVGNDDFECD